MTDMSNYTLVEKEKVEQDGKPFYRLYLYSHKDGSTLKVLSPIVTQEILINDTNTEVHPGQTPERSE